MILALIDEDVLRVEHVFGLLTGLTVGLKLSGAFVPDENLVFRPDDLLKATLAHIHYMPDHWKGNAHTSRVRDEFSQFFKYRVVVIFQEIISAFVTPFILIFWLRPKSLEIVDFFRNFTVDVTGVGDVCSFAEMDIRKHGHPHWVPPDLKVESNQINQAENGKTELSLMHFAITNPNWVPPGQSSIYINHLREQIQQSTADFSCAPMDNSLNSSSSFEADYSRYAGRLRQSRLFNLGSMTSTQVPRSSMSGTLSGSVSRAPPVLLGAVNHVEGPISADDLMCRSNMSSVQLSESSHYQSFLPYEATGTTGALSHEMGCSALYMHEHYDKQRKSTMPNYADAPRRGMPHIQESTYEDHVESSPLLDNRITK